MSKPPFSRKRKGKTVDPYPLRDKSPSKSTSTKRSRSGRPRKAKKEGREGDREVRKSRKGLEEDFFFKKEEHRRKKDALVWATFWESVGYEVELVRRKNTNWYGLEDGYIYEVWVKETEKLKVPGRSVQEGGGNVTFEVASDLYGMTMDEFNIVFSKQPYWVGRDRPGTEVYAIEVGRDDSGENEVEAVYYVLGRSEEEANDKLKRDRKVGEHADYQILATNKIGKLEDLEITEQYEMLRNKDVIGLFEEG